MPYKDDRHFGDKYLKCAINGLKSRGFQSVDITCDALDMKQSADLIGVRGHEEITIAFRTRRIEYFNRYGNQFTLRYRRSNGSKTEFEKIMEGHGDWMLYGFVDDENIAKYVLFNLDGVRCRAKQIGDINHREIPNKSKKTFFVWFEWRELPASCLIDSNFVNKNTMMPDSTIDWLDEYIRHSSMSVKANSIVY